MTTAATRLFLLLSVPTDNEEGLFVLLLLEEDCTAMLL